jgi:hypothetical protein
VAASYDPVELLVLSFNQAIDASGIVGSAIQLDDPVYAANLWAATGEIEMIDPATVRLTLIGIDDSTGTVDVLNASAGNGIVAVDGGDEWSGVSDLVLPFP